MQYKNYYKNVASIFDKLRLDQKYEFIIMGKIIKEFVDPQKGPIFDIGCGTCRYSLYFNEIGYDVIGIDISKEQLRNAPKTIPIINGFASKLPIKCNQFGCCTIILALHQFNSYNKALSEAFRVLIPGGYLFIKTCSHLDLKRRPFGEAFPSALPININRYPDILQLKKDLKFLRFKIVKTLSTFSEQEMKKDDLIFSIKQKHNTTLALIPDDEFKSGSKKLENQLKNSKTVTIPNYHTIIVAIKP